MTTIRRPDPSTPWGRALSEQPAWVQARAYLDSLPPRITYIDPGAAAEAWVCDEFRDGKVPTDAQIIRTHAQRQAEAIRARAVNLCHEEAANLLDNAVSPDAMARSFHAQLQDVFAEVRELLDMFGGSDPGYEAANDAGLLDQHKRLRVLRADCAAIRADQNRNWNRGNGDGRKMRSVLLAFIANPLADPDYIPRRLHLKIRDKDGREREPRPVPWPLELWQPDATDWLATHPEFEGWAPTRAQYEAKEAKLLRIVQEASAEAEKHGGSNIWRIR